MKTIEVEFYSWTACTMVIEVSDDYQLSGDNPYLIWEDICENEDIDPEDLLTSEYWEIPEIEWMGLDYIDSITIINEEGEVEQNRQFEKIIWDDWSRDRD